MKRTPSLADFVGASERDVFGKTARLQRFVTDMREKGWYAYSRVVDSPNEAVVSVRDEDSNVSRPMLMFSSNNYLGLASHPRVIEAAQRAASEYGMGVGGSPLVCGTSRLHRELEERIAAFEGREDAMLFPSGYAANLGAISALLRPGDVALADRLVHASVIDGCAFSGSRITIFRHNNVESLQRELQRVDDDAGRLVLAEGVYSMDGDIAPMPEIMAVARRYGARVLLDEAHATGVLGATGRGSSEHWGHEHAPDLVMGTLSKSLGSQGGFIAGDKDVLQYLRLYSRSHFFSTSLTAPQVAAALAAIEVLAEETWRVDRLRSNGEYLRRRLTDIGLIPIGGGTPIVPVMVGDEAVAYEVGKRLHEAGAFAIPIPFPAVPRDRSRIRLSVMATHEQAHIDLIVEMLDRICAECNVPRYRPEQQTAA